MTTKLVEPKELTRRGAPIHPVWLAKQIAQGALATTMVNGRRVIELSKLLALIKQLAQAPGPAPKHADKGWIR